MIGVATLVIGVIVGYVGENMLDFLLFPTGASLFLITLAVFSFSFLFFGFPSPIIMLFVGIHMGWILKNIPGEEAKIVVLGVCSLLASLSSVMLGISLLEDMRGKGNFKKVLKISLVLILIAVVISAGFDLTS